MPAGCAGPVWYLIRIGSYKIEAVGSKIWASKLFTDRGRMKLKGRPREEGELKLVHRGAWHKPGWLASAFFRSRQELKAPGALMGRIL